MGILITAQSEFATLKKGLDPYSCGYLWAEYDEARNLASLNYVEPPLPVEVALYSFLGGLSPWPRDPVISLKVVSYNGPPMILSYSCHLSLLLDL